MHLPFFRFGLYTSPSNGALPLGLISGGLILDSGEAEQTFIFRCQDRYLIYNSLCNLRSLLFVANAEHLAIYQRLIAGLSAQLQKIEEFTGLSLGSIPEPFYVACDINEMTVKEQNWFVEKLKTPNIAASLAQGSLLLNQVSPSYAELLTQIDSILRRHGCDLSLDLVKLQELGQLAMKFHNKTSYVDLVHTMRESLPPHVITAVISPQDFLALESWEDLVKLYRSRTGDECPQSLFVKSSLDSGGNVAARLCADNFATRAEVMKRELERHILWQGVDERESLDSLRQEVALAPSLRSMALSDARLSDYRRLQRVRRTGIDLLVQSAVVGPENSRYAFHSIGITYDIRGLDDHTLIAAAAQLYDDADQHHFIGSYLSDSLTEEVMTRELGTRMHALCRLFAAQGYRGPINFDARLGPSNQYIFIYDCNPRLSALYPPLALREHLRRQGLLVESISSLGYRGEFIYRDSARPMTELSALDLLYTPRRQRGVILLPNLSRDRGFDALLINMSREEIKEFVNSGVLFASAEPESCGRRTVF
jgi:hypothetical protein